MSSKYEKEWKRLAKKYPAIDKKKTQFERIISNIVYLGPLREFPAPLYGGSSERPQDVGTSGEDAAIVLWVGRNERKQIQLRRKVEKWIADFEIARNLKLHKLGPFFQLLLTDVGFGVTCPQ